MLPVVGPDASVFPLLDGDLDRVFVTLLLVGLLTVLLRNLVAFGDGVVLAVLLGNVVAFGHGDVVAFLLGNLGAFLLVVVGWFAYFLVMSGALLLLLIFALLLV